MSARVSTVKKLFSCGKPQKESLDRKTRTGVGWNKYLDLHMTHPSLLQSFLSPRARSNRGPNWFKHTRGECRIAKIFKFCTAKSERTTTMIDVKGEMTLAEYEAKRDEIDGLLAKVSKLPMARPLSVALIFEAICDHRIGRLADRVKAVLVALAMDEFAQMDAATRDAAINGAVGDGSEIAKGCMARAEGRFFEAVEAA